MEVKWEKGIWLGISRESNETLIGANGGVIRCYAIKRMPAEDKWNKELIAEIKGTPQQPNPTKAGLHIPIRLDVETDLGVVPPAPLQSQRRARRSHRFQQRFQIH